jgi:hypothetical protein
MKIRPLHFFSIEVRARAAARLPKEQSTALVSCWVDFPLESGALAIAKLYIADDGYRMGRVRAHAWISEPRKVPADQRGSVRDARRFGACFVYRFESAPRVRGREARKR